MVIGAEALLHNRGTKTVTNFFSDSVAGIATLALAVLPILSLAMTHV